MTSHTTAPSPAAPLRRPGKEFAIGLGCELRHADLLVHSAGLDLDADAAVSIGPGCKTCSRTGCAQRAYRRSAGISRSPRNRGTFAPYPISE